MKKITLTQGKYALVSDEDFEYLNQWKWYVVKKKTKEYAMHSFGRKHVSLHRFILNPPQDKQVDHINGNGLDNRRQNLRFCNQYQNNANTMKQNKTTGFKGVEAVTNRPGNWFARIRIYGKRTYLGNFHSSMEAAKAYNEAALKYFGEFAKLNKI